MNNEPNVAEPAPLPALPPKPAAAPVTPDGEVADQSAAVVGWGCLSLVVGVALLLLYFWQSQVALAAIIIAIVVVLALFPWFLQISFEQIKKERIRGDVWVDLINLGYWSKLKLSAQANELMLHERAGGRATRTGESFSGSVQMLAKFLSIRTGAKLEPSGDPEKRALYEFNDRINEHYGAGAFLWPLVILTALYLLGWFSILTGGLSLGVEKLLTDGFAAYVKHVADNTSIVSAAFLGAYLFSIQSLFRRYVRSDFKPAAITQASLRFITAGIVAFLLTMVYANGKLFDAAVPQETMKLAGFVTGIFPWNVVRWMFDYLVGVLPFFKRARWDVANAELTELDGLDNWDKERLEEAGINYAGGLATVDLLDLLIAVRMPTETLLDWVDQAILRIHLSEDMWHSFIGKTPIRTATDFLDAMERGNKEKLVQLMKASGQSDNKEEQAAVIGNLLDVLVDSLARDPNIAYLKTFRAQMQMIVEQGEVFPRDWAIRKPYSQAIPPAQEPVVSKPATAQTVGPSGH